MSTSIVLYIYIYRKYVKLFNDRATISVLASNRGIRSNPRTLSSVENHQHSTVYCDDCASEYREKRDSYANRYATSTNIAVYIPVRPNVNGRKDAIDQTILHALIDIFNGFYVIFTHREMAFFFNVYST